MKEVVYPPDDVFPDLHEIDIEGEKVMESVYPEKQYRLLVEPLYASRPEFAAGRSFQAFMGVGLFFRRGHPGLCPDLMIALDTEAGDLDQRANKSYFTWERGRAPDLVIEIVSDRDGDEDGGKLRTYQEIGVRYYVIYDPRNQLRQGLLRCYARTDVTYRQLDEPFFEGLGVGMTFWTGEFEEVTWRWLRWCDRHGQLLLTGSERAAATAQRADAEAQRADAEAQRADRERARAEALEARLRALGELP